MSKSQLALIRACKMRRAPSKDLGSAQWLRVFQIAKNDPRLSEVYQTMLAQSHKIEGYNGL
jgi:hypothetical protein